MSEPPIDVAEYPPPGSIPEPPARRRRGRGLVKLLAFFIVLIGLFGAGALYFVAQSHGTTGGKPVTVTIQQGATASSIANQLGRQDVIRSPWLFRLLARTRGTAGSLKPGVYEMRTGMSYDAVFALLEQGPKIAFVSVTIPEGRTVGQVAQIVHEKLGIQTAEFLAAVRARANRPAIVPAGARDLEGVLYPETYFFRPEATATDVVRRLVEEFERRTAGLDFAAARTLGLSPYQAIVLASLVEREAKADADRSKIASVIYNRMKRGMRLEIDATVQYAIYLRTGTVPTRIDTGDLKIDSPYNTYRIPALPPGPIASPGLPSIRAALAPAGTDFLFYVLSTDGVTHCFARTFEEFRAYVTRARTCV